MELLKHLGGIDMLRKALSSNSKLDFYTPHGIYEFQVPFVKNPGVNDDNGKATVHYCKVEVRVGNEYIGDEKEMLITLFEDNNGSPVNNFVGDIMTTVVRGFIEQITRHKYPCEVIKKCMQQYNMNGKRYVLEWDLTWDEKRGCYLGKEHFVSIDELNSTN